VEGTAGGEEVQVGDDPERRRFLLTVGGEPAGFLQYKVRPPNLVLAHTEIAPEFQGRGFGGALARAALDTARERGLAVDVMCPFVAAWIDRHPAYGDLLTG
jgi:uncharacterized protein